MKKSTIAVALLFATAGAVAAETSIPVQFQGKWATSADCKAAKRGDPEAAMNVLQVTAKSINGAEWGCDVKKTLETSQSRFSGVFACMGDGVGADKERVSIDLDNGKARFTDNGGQVFNNTDALPRCK